VTTSEDTDYAFKTTDFGFANTAGESDTLNGVKISALPASGTLYLGSLANPVNPGDLISLGNIPNLKFHPNTNANGSPLTSFLFQVQDTGGTATITAGAYSASGIDLDPAPKTMQIVGTSVHDAPNATGSTVTVYTQAPGQTHVFTINDFGFADNADLPNGNQPLNILIGTTVPATGLTYQGNPVTANLLIPAVNVGQLVYTAPATAGQTTFTFQIQDNG